MINNNIIIINIIIIYLYLNRQKSLRKYIII